MSRIAVIVPCHNDGALAREAVASIVEDEQIEVVVIDDGSTDPATREQLASLQRDGVRVVRRENGGLGAARNTGLQATSAPLVYPLDADDLLEPGALAAMADQLEENPQAQFTWGDYVVFGDYDGRYRSPERFLPWTLTYVNPYPVSSMFRRSALTSAGGWEGEVYEDWDLWLKLVGMGVSGVRTDRVVYRRRLHGGGRLLGQARRRHGELYALIRERHGELLARRPQLLASERPAAWKRLVYPLLFGARSVVPPAIEAWMQRTMLKRGGGLPG